MIPQIFKKKQESYSEYCVCNLSSNSSSFASKGEKFLTRLQTQPPRPKLQVNKNVKFIDHKKQRVYKLSLKKREKKAENTENCHQRGTINLQRQKVQLNLAFNNHPQTFCLEPQNTNTTRPKALQIEQYTFSHPNALRQQLSQLRIDENQENHEKRANTQKSTVMSNLTQLKYSIQMPSIKNYSTKYQSKESISISENQQQLHQQPNELPKSRAFSTNFIRRNSIIDSLQFRKQENQAVQNCNNPQPRKDLGVFTQIKLTDLMFRSAQSISEQSSQQFSELASSNQYHSHPSIKQGSWSTSLNQIFAKKVRRMSHNPDAQCNK